MATLLFKFVFVSNASPQVVLTSTELTGADAPTINISTVALADGTTIASVVSGGALVYDGYTKTWSYRLASADLASYVYVGMATTTYATASPASVHALGIVIPDELTSTRLATSGYTAPPSASTVASQVRTELTTELGRVDAAITSRGTSTLDAAGVRDAMKLAPSAGTPATGSVDKHLDDLVDAVDAVDGVVDAILVDTGTTLPAQIAAPSVGSNAVGITVTDGSYPLDGVHVWATTDSGGANVVASGATNALGLATLMLDTGTYYIWQQLSGWNFTNPQTLVVS